MQISHPLLQDATACSSNAQELNKQSIKVINNITQAHNFTLIYKENA
jgi:hypothetical protein